MSSQDTDSWSDNCSLIQQEQPNIITNLMTVLSLRITLSEPAFVQFFSRHYIKLISSVQQSCYITVMNCHYRLQEIGQYDCRQTRVLYCQVNMVRGLLYLILNESGINLHQHSVYLSLLQHWQSDVYLKKMQHQTFWDLLKHCMHRQLRVVTCMHGITAMSHMRPPLLTVRKEEDGMT